MNDGGGGYGGGGSADLALSSEEGRVSRGGRRGREKTVRRVWFGVLLALEETFRDREGRKTKLGSDSELAQAEKVLANVICKLAPAQLMLALYQEDGEAHT